ncbi:MAG TPA: hypothetical protein VJL35_13930 [Gemmatimonadaceae bacterium]|nr:hypothetical protein [Gemmatimonadaceae bacterium]
MAAHIAIQKSPKPVQALFKHTEEHQRRGMLRLYEQGSPIDPSRGTLLFWVPGGMPLLLHVETSIAAAMKLRGYNVHAIICNAPYRGCAIRTVQEGVPIARWRDVCPTCTRKTTAVLETMGIPYSYNGDFLTEAERAEIWRQTADVTWDSLDTLSWEGLNVGRNVKSSITRYLQGAALTGHEAVIHEYAYSGLVSACAASRAYDRFKPWRVFMSHGVYIDWGPALHTAFRRGIPVTGWKASYLSWHFYLRHVEDPTRIDFKKLSRECWSQIKNSDLTPEAEARLDKFLIDRYQNNISFDMKQRKTYRKDVSDLKQKYAPTEKPVWAVFAHINWDSVSDYAPMAYPSFDDWMIDTIEHAITVPDVQWLIKIHPVEAWDNPASGVQRLIERVFPSLPDHVRVIPAEEDISPANLYELIDGGVTVYGTAGLELSLMGKPVILAGEAHYGGLGFTHEGHSPERYRELLSRAARLGSLTKEQHDDVRKYAYSHFVQREIPLEVVHDPRTKWWGLMPEKRDLLLPGNDAFIQFICDRLVDGKDFNMPEELVAMSEREVVLT